MRTSSSGRGQRHGDSEIGKKPGKNNNNNEGKKKYIYEPGSFELESHQRVGQPLKSAGNEDFRDGDLEGRTWLGLCAPKIDVAIASCHSGGLRYHDGVTCRRSILRSAGSCSRLGRAYARVAVSPLLDGNHGKAQCSAVDTEGGPCT